MFWPTIMASVPVHKKKYKLDFNKECMFLFIERERAGPLRERCFSTLSRKEIWAFSSRRASRLQAIL